MRGYCGIGVYHPQHECNLGTLFRSAVAFGADFIFTIGKKYKPQNSDTCRSYKHIPCFNYVNLQDFKDHIPKDCKLVCVEIDDRAREIKNFIHPDRAIYIIGNEGGGIPQELMKSSLVVRIKTSICLNLSVAGSIILYDRMNKQ